jgi:hypothetical protein
MLKTLLTIIMASYVGHAMAQDSTSAIGDDTANAEQGKEKADAPPADAKAKAAKEVVLPQHWKSYSALQITSEVKT